MHAISIVSTTVLAVYMCFCRCCHVPRAVVLIIGLKNLTRDSTTYTFQLFVWFRVCVLFAAPANEFYMYEIVNIFPSIVNLKLCNIVIDQKKLYFLFFFFISTKMDAFIIISFRFVNSLNFFVTFPPSNGNFTSYRHLPIDFSLNCHFNRYISEIYKQNNIKTARCCRKLAFSAVFVIFNPLIHW